MIWDNSYHFSRTQFPHFNKIDGMYSTFLTTQVIEIIRKHMRKSETLGNIIHDHESVFLINETDGCVPLSVSWSAGVLELTELRI